MCAIRVKSTDNVVILSERSESKNLGTDLTANFSEMPSSLDFARDDSIVDYTVISRYFKLLTV